MNASRLTSELEQLVEKHRDLPITVALGTHEYSVISASFVSQGPLPNIGESQQQTPPDRIVLAVRDNIT